LVPKGVKDGFRQVCQVCLGETLLLVSRTDLETVG